MFRNGGWGWGVVVWGGEFVFLQGGGGISYRSWGECSWCRSTSCSLIINSSYSHPFEEGCLEHGIRLSQPAGGRTPVGGGWGRDGEGVRFLAFLEHCCLLMNENLMQPVRGPIVADFG